MDQWFSTFLALSTLILKKMAAHLSLKKDQSDGNIGVFVHFKIHLENWLRNTDRLCHMLETRTKKYITNSRIKRPNK